MIGLEAIKDAIKQTGNQYLSGKNHFSAEHQLEIK
jgi:hypothetical protein